MPNIIVVDTDTNEIVAMANDKELSNKHGYKILIEDESKPFIYGTKNDKKFLIY